MRLYSTLSRQLEELPAPPGPVGIYVCGPTVYQRIHIGNARPFVLSMWLRRWLLETGYEVKLVENITDVNDKIYEAAEREEIPSGELAVRATRWYLEDTEALGLGRPDVEPLATETIPEIVALIGELVERGLAYESQGDVYYRVEALAGLRRSLGREARRHGRPGAERPEGGPARLRALEGDEAARGHGLGLAMGERPAGLAHRVLGDGREAPRAEFEIHGGGLDLRFPHHENELAQSRGAGREFARIWAHNGMLQLDEEKMSKSVGNIVSLREALDRWGREAILVFFLGGHYRSPLDFSEEAMEAAAAQAEAFRTAFRTAAEREAEYGWDDFAAALDDDFSTPRGARDSPRLARRRAAGPPRPRALASSGSESRRAGRRPTGFASSPSPPGRPREPRLRRRPTACAGDRGAGWEVQDVPDGFRLVPRA